MSDWIDLQLAHSLTRAPAPDELWARINPNCERQVNGPVAPRRRPIAIRWAVPVAIAACGMIVLARRVREDRVFAASDPAAVSKRMAHEKRPVSKARTEVAANTTACKHCHSL